MNKTFQFTSVFPSAASATHALDSRKSPANTESCRQNIRSILMSGNLNCRKLSSLEIENHRESSFENTYLNTAALTKRMVLLLFYNFKMRAPANLMLIKIFGFLNILTSY